MSFSSIKVPCHAIVCLAICVVISYHSYFQEKRKLCHYVGAPYVVVRHSDRHIFIESCTNGSFTPNSG